MEGGQKKDGEVGDVKNGEQMAIGKLNDTTEKILKTLSSLTDEKLQLEEDLKELKEQVFKTKELSLPQTNNFLELLQKIEEFKVECHHESEMIDNLKNHKKNLHLEFEAYVYQVEKEVNKQEEERIDIERKLQELHEIMQSETEQREKLEYENQLLAAKVTKFQTIISRELKQCTKENETLRREVEILNRRIREITNQFD